MENTKLHFDFSPLTPKEWKQKIQVDLKGADYNESLVWESPEGIKVKPFYHQEDTGHDSISAANCPQPWHLGEFIRVENAEVANTKAMDILKKGTESIVFRISSEAMAPEILLKGIDLKKIQLHFLLDFLSEEYLEAVVKSSPENPAGIFFHTDILGNLARTGNWYTGQKEDHDTWDEILKKYGQKQGFHCYSVDMSLYQNAGANSVQQLAYGLAHIHEYINHSEGKNIGQAVFYVAVGSDYFFEIAKLRALRILYSTLAKDYGLSTDCHILAVPSHRNKTLYDYNTNMLRTTTECMSAVLGNADTVVNMPYDALYHHHNDFGDRIARNQLLLLKEESHLDKVSNPAAGSYYIETITRQLAEKALQLFKQIEAGGGFLAQLRNHNIQKKIADNAKKEQQAFDQQERILVGTNKYQNPEDRMKNDLEIDPFRKIRRRKTLIEPILERRLAEGIEKTRLENE
ncbi:methylmalonyl-CoA mutase subunit beta [Zeaxanthinibacter sp. PT1]|uniref:methylmalonyl-CoA mutase subunit beta n=1 Tax=Zeaxanthinibacter TaxID=561554 RepID=UPI00234BAE01|nr:methylmalonyl-CoA mutase subunit beta [Zeaxanthinibacter sp. PT1]MDC6352184.1 methylmalonyl-CoA mutase subunit beta [Zeaxanthinibacter sp. PT1]